MNKQKTLVETPSHTDTSIITASDAALRYIAAMHGAKVPLEPFSAAVTAQALASALHPYKTPVGREADSKMVMAISTAQQQAECGSCDGFNSGCEECSGLGKDGHLAALRQLANVAHRVAHAMGLPAGFDVTTLPDVVAQRLTAQQQAEPVQLKVAANNWPKQCPITRRDFFMEIDGVPTYGGPYDSYTIPEMTGQPNQPWHERELFVRRYDHDFGSWVEDEFIPLRVIHEDVLMELEDAAKAGEDEPVELDDDDIISIADANGFDINTPEGVIELCKAVASYAAQPPAVAVPDAQQIEVVRRLIWLAHTVVIALDDSEEREGEDGRIHVIDADNFDAISDALDDLEELPDDKPGYTLSASGKAEWALRAMLAAAQKGGAV